MFVCARSVQCELEMRATVLGFDTDNTRTDLTHSHDVRSATMLASTTTTVAVRAEMLAVRVRRQNVRYHVVCLR
jgi:hypothetical protein